MPCMSLLCNHTKAFRSDGWNVRTIIKQEMARSCVSEWHTWPVDSLEAACYLTVCLAKVTRLGGVISEMEVHAGQIEG